MSCRASENQPHAALYQLHLQVSGITDGVADLQEGVDLDFEDSTGALAPATFDPTDDAVADSDASSICSEEYESGDEAESEGGEGSAEGSEEGLEVDPCEPLRSAAFKAVKAALAELS